MANFKQINKEVRIQDFLAREGINPASSTSDGKLYYPHFFDGEVHRHLNFVVDTYSNRWFDHHSGQTKGDTVINLVMIMKRLNAHDAAEYLAKLFNIQPERTSLPIRKTSIKSKNGSVEVTGLLSPAYLYDNVKAYLHQRGIRNFEYVNKYCEQVFFTYHDGDFKGQNFYGLGFKNRSGGYEIRNSLNLVLHKASIGTKDITIADNHSDKWLVMEGFVDFLCLPDFDGWGNKCNVIVLNSTALFERTFPILDNVPGKNIFLLLDHDDEGNKKTAAFQQRYPSSMDIRARVLGYHKDLNERLVKEREMMEKEIKLFKWRNYYV